MYNTLTESKPMAKGTIPPYKRIELEDTDNGYLLTYEEKLPKPVDSEWGGTTNYTDRKLSYTDAQEDEAFEKFKELKKACRAARGGK